MSLSLLAFLVLGYLCGSVPFGLLLTKLGGTEDLRSIGSGNIGATNVLRTGRKGLAAGTLVCDALKATIPALIGLQWGLGEGMAAAAGAFFGHLFPVWLKFRGGKGVATMIGALLGLYWPAALVFCGVWILVAVATKYSSASALTAAALTPFFILWAGRNELAALFMVLSLLLIFMHRENITRLMAGTESKIGQKT